MYYLAHQWQKDKEHSSQKCNEKKSAIAEHLVNNTYCGNNFDISKFSIMRQCSNTLELIRLEDILIHLNKPNLFKKKEFDYNLALFSKKPFCLCWLAWI